jgi:hypothetical protein
MLIPPHRRKTLAPNDIYLQGEFSAMQAAIRP